MGIPANEKHIPLFPCPFCGATGHTYLRKYPNGETSPSMMLWHDDWCPMEHVIESFDNYEDEQALADAWNRRYEEP